MRRGLALLLAASMVLTGCSAKTSQKEPEQSATETESTASEGMCKAGTYEGSAEGFGGPLTVRVTLTDDSIEKVEAVSHSEIEGVGIRVTDAPLAVTMEQNSLDADMIAETTVFSKAIITVVRDAMKDFTQTDSTPLVDGVYTGEVTGYQGPPKLEVIIADSKIDDIKILEHVEVEGIGTKALKAVPERVIENQSIAVDTFPGATPSSKVVLAAVTSALETADADLSVFMSKPVMEKGEAVTVDADVAIIGAGGAGITVATEAKNQGAEEVAVIKKMDITGGNTRMSRGEFAAPGNWIQIKEGVTDDSMDQYYEDILKGGYNPTNPKLVRTIAEQVLPTAVWLKDEIGVKLCDNQSWYGGHVVARTLWSEGDGPAYVDILGAKARQLGTEFYPQTEAISLLTDESEKIVGAKAAHKSGTEYTFNASSGVIVVTGGPGADVEMCEEYNTLWPTLDESIPTTDSPAITGDGTRTVLDAGANVVGMDKIQLYPVNNPATGNYYYIDYARLNFTALLINKEGHRFVNEKKTRDVIFDAIPKQTGSMVYEIIDTDMVAEQKLYEEYQVETDQCLEKGVPAIGILDKVCTHFDVPAEEVKKSIERYNSLVESGKDTDFGRTDNSNKIGDGPYFIFSSAVSVHHTTGGLEIDELAHVIDKNGDTVPGLYAAGEVTGSIHGGNRLDSVVVPDTVIFGRIVAESCVKQK